jgi:hypothetical protein
VKPDDVALPLLVPALLNEYTKAGIEALEKTLQAAVQAKEDRLHPAWDTCRAQRKAEKLGYAARSAAQSSYQGSQLGASSSSNSTMRSAEEEAEFAFYGTEDGGVGLDPCTTKGEQHASDMSTEGPQVEDFAVETEDGYVFGGRGPFSAVAVAKVL